MKLTHDDTIHPKHERSNRTHRNCSDRAAFLSLRTRAAAWFAWAACTGIAFASRSGDGKSPLPNVTGASSSIERAVKDPAQRVGARLPIPSLPGLQPSLPRSAFAPFGRTIDHDRVYFRDTADALWSRGTAYKSEFRSDRTTYVPYFGAQSGSRPISFHLDAAAVGGRAIAVAAGTGEIPARDGARISMKRGALVEQYDVSSASMEQRFVFDSLPGTGDLTLRIGFDTDLAASSSESGIEFTGELGAVHYSSAIAIDANGKRCPAATVLDGDAIVITVPASFIAGATFPLTIDPVISTIHVVLSGWDDSCADVTYDASTNRWFVVYQEWYSQNDNDAYAAEFDANGNQIYIESIDMSFDDWTNMKAANNALADQFLVVADVNAGGHHSIKGIEVSAADFAVAPTLSIADFPGVSCVHPDVGGDPSSSAPTYYCVTWERVDAAGEHDIQAQMVKSDDTLLFGPISIDVTQGTIDTRPAISKCDGNMPNYGQEWMIVWQREFSPTDHDVRAARVTWSGIISQSSFAIDNSVNDDTNPRVSSPTDWTASGRRYLVVFEREYAPQDHDIWGAIVSGISVPDEVDLTVIEDLYDADFDQVLPTVDSDGSQFTIAFIEQIYSLARNICLVEFNCAGDKIGLSDARQTLTAIWADHPQITSVRSGGGSGTRYLAVYDASNPGYGRDIFGGMYDAPAGGPVSEFCGASNFACPCGNGGAQGNGCASSANPNGAHLTAQGTASVAHDTLLLWGTGMPSSSTCIYIQGDTVVNALFGDGWRCAGGQLLRIATKQNSGGASSYPHWNDPLVSVKGQVPAIGGTRYYQTYYRDPASFCTALTYNITNAISATWVP